MKRWLRVGAGASLIALILVCLAWEGWIAPLRPQTDLGSETGNTADDRGGALEGSLK